MVFKSNRDKAVRMPILSGNVPFNKFDCNSIILMAFNLLILSGIVPMKLFDAKFSFLKEVINPILLGIVPVRLFLFVTKCVRL